MGDRPERVLRGRGGRDSGDRCDVATGIDAGRHRCVVTLLHVWTTGGWQALSATSSARGAKKRHAANGANAFNGGNKNYTVIGAADLIWHF